MTSPRNAATQQAPQVQVRIYASSPDLMPTQGTASSAGLDLRAAGGDYLLPGERKLVATGIAIALPDGWEAQVRPRSGLALVHGVTVLNAPGTIDADYRGEVCVLLHNTGDGPYAWTRGERIAQLVVQQVPRVQLLEVDSHAQLGSTDRGEGGFGSTGTD